MRVSAEARFITRCVRAPEDLHPRELQQAAQVWLVGTAYNSCWPHDSLRLLAPPGAPRKWRQRTPAMAAGLTDQCWTLNELLRFQVPLPRWVPPKRRGRPPKHPPLKTAA